MYIAETLLSFETYIAQYTKTIITFETYNAHYTEILLTFEMCITHSGRNTHHLWNIYYSLSKSTTLLCNMHYSLRRNTTDLKICIVQYTKTYLPLTQELLTTVRNNSPLKHALLATHSALNQQMINQSICTYMSYFINIT